MANSDWTLRQIIDYFKDMTVKMINCKDERCLTVFKYGKGYDDKPDIISELQPTVGITLGDFISFVHWADQGLIMEEEIIKC